MFCTYNLIIINHDFFLNYGIHAVVKWAYNTDYVFRIEIMHVVFRKCADRPEHTTHTATSASRVFPLF